MQLLIKKAPLFDVPLAEPPSIRDQTPWECRFFEFGKAQLPKLEYFNPGFVVRPDGHWLLTRRSHWKEGLRFGMNDIMAFHLRDRVPTHGIKVKIPSSQDDEQFEDPRVVYHKGRTWVSCCNFVWYKTSWTGAHQVLAEVDNDWRTIKRWDIDYGGNGNALGKNTVHQKNWLWFFHEDQPHLIYSAQPHTLVRFNPTDFAKEEEFTTHQDLAWEYGTVRGGSPPTLIGDEYLTFFHSSIPWTMQKRRYVMGAYTFEPKPPFRILRITEKPLLVGSWHDPWNPSKPLVVFNGGQHFDNGFWFVTLGVNDMKSAWINIPHEDLEARMRPV